MKITTLSYLEVIKRIKSNPYLYVSVYGDAQKNLSNEEFKILQQKLSLA